MFELRSGSVRATVAARAASLRDLRVAGVGLVEPTTHRSAAPGMAGAVLVPWPNRVEDARWVHAGEPMHLEVTEPELGHALHGLLADVDYRVVHRASDALLMQAGIEEPPGYPFRLRVRVAYRLLTDGILTRVDVENVGSGVAPVAVGAHPYLRVGDTPIDELHVSLDANHVWALDARHLPTTRDHIGPTAAVPVTAMPDHALFERAGASSAPVRHLIRGADGIVELSADSAMPWTQWYVAPALDTADGPRRALAIEPMSAPPNALRSGVGLRRVAPGELVGWRWSIRLSR